MPPSSLFPETPRAPVAPRSKARQSRATGPPRPRPDGEPAAAERERSDVAVVVVEHPNQLVPYLDSWRALAERAAEPNVFYEPAVLLPALRAFAGQRRLALVLVIGLQPDPAGANLAAPALWGLFPLERCARGTELPVPCLRLWQHAYSYVPTPLVDRTHGAAVMTAFFDWLSAQALAPALLVMNKLPVGGPFHQVLIEELGRRRATVLVRDRGTRALLAPDCDAATYQARSMTGKHRRELRRRHKQLASLGQLRVDELPGGDSIDGWIAEFLAIERAGWKGREGTALASNATDARFFAEMARAIHAAGKLSFTAVRLDGRPIAMQVTLRAGRGAFAFKLGYDETFARYSPGVLLALDLVERVAAGRGAAWIDSCAAQDHDMVGRLWTERRSLESWVVSGGPASGLLLAAWPALAWLKRTLRIPRPASRGES
ncbi:MAG TPA: GNAT family N-acetyltransferase [Polyangia bacterium]|nr:GNAT family N-acetyltransferase [Polyangia bacterium]